jgi:hypothetical protein
MGDRYIIIVECPSCGFIDDNCPYAPTCGFRTWRCPVCKKVVDLETYTGISEAEASNKDEIRRIVNELAQDYGLCDCGYPFPASGHCRSCGKSVSDLEKSSA